jgi:hypothetical protein
LTTTLRVAIIVSEIKAAVSRQSFAARGPMVFATIESCAGGVTPPLKREGADRDKVAVAHSRASKKTLDP